MNILRGLCKAISRAILVSTVGAHDKASTFNWVPRKRAGRAAADATADRDPISPVAW